MEVPHAVLVQACMLLLPQDSGWFTVELQVCADCSTNRLQHGMPSGAVGCNFQCPDEHVLLVALAAVLVCKLDCHWWSRTAVGSSWDYRCVCQDADFDK